jgi:hypothetical protein
MCPAHRPSALPPAPPSDRAALPVPQRAARLSDFRHPELQAALHGAALRMRAQLSPSELAMLLLALDELGGEPDLAPLLQQVGGRDGQRPAEGGSSAGGQAAEAAAAAPPRPAHHQPEPTSRRLLPPPQAATLAGDPGALWAARALDNPPPRVQSFAKPQHSGRDLVTLLSAVASARQMEAGTCLAVAESLQVGAGYRDGHRRCWGRGPALCCQGCSQVLGPRSSACSRADTRRLPLPRRRAACTSSPRASWPSWRLPWPRATPGGPTCYRSWRTPPPRSERARRWLCAAAGRRTPSCCSCGPRCRADSAPARPACLAPNAPSAAPALALLSAPGALCRCSPRRVVHTTHSTPLQVWQRVGARGHQERGGAGAGAGAAAAAAPAAGRGEPGRGEGGGAGPGAEPRPSCNRSRASLGSAHPTSSGAAGPIGPACHSASATAEPGP